MSAPTAAELEARVLGGDRTVTAQMLADARNAEHLEQLMAQAEQRRAAEQAQADQQAARAAAEAATAALMAPEALAEGRRVYAELVDRITQLKAIHEVFLAGVSDVMNQREALGMAYDPVRLGIPVATVEQAAHGALQDVVGVPHGWTQNNHPWRAPEALKAREQAAGEDAERVARERREQAEADRNRSTSEPLPAPGGLVVGDVIVSGSTPQTRVWRAR